ncbi:hypothetical protein [uncultured Thomasclavelia sp.]|uniref:hypothetical protein n=1 Tax=uncultured Thomasclavelia sp. TaxID=3025759 RepID=UPI0026254394|nr:hypothetical protein [uncultured Thomasclavelia sp.]
MSILQFLLLMIFISISYFRDKLIILNNLLNVLLIIFCYDNVVKNGGVKMNPAVAIVIMSIIEVIGINIFLRHRHND